VHHHGEALRTITRDDALVEALSRDFRTADLKPADRAMLDYCHKLTVAPAEMVRADVEGLREAGFDDVAILDICQVAAYFAFVNRMADGLGVEFEGPGQLP
jgi:uncharacterized peroxidase-related enzyme